MSRTALYEWIAVAVLLLGCAVVTAGVISLDVAPDVAHVLMIAGAVVAIVGAVIWTVVVKRGARARDAA